MKSMIKALADSASDEPPPPHQLPMAAFSSCPHMAEWAESSDPLLYKDTNPILGLHSHDFI